ncbi:PKD domain-containing protein [Flavobacterium pectinovorum]|jgi:PKD repeat protein|uniref:PKD domain-containing protein n=1 Tax=Flavobacterium pectinovorum TaxID=29533 RepID=A0A502EIR8_9FLAO|nr:PKD domain-containing protein [Flavobacterium pectinovorum]TPG36390.1 PKD domain-containing protein [Flavobacterium pectinovorum]
MKTKFKIVCIVAVLVLGYSCSKSDVEKGIDCFGESFFMKFKHTTDPANVKKVDFVVDYTGSYEFKSVKWNFGDGTSETTTSKTLSHIYTTAGTYNVKADITIQHGKATCTASPIKSVTVN